MNSIFARLKKAPVVSLLIALPWLLGNTECNIFAGAANKESAAALLFSAQEKINQGDYAGALTDISKMTAADRATHDGRIMEASARVGLCGFNMLNMATDLANSNATNPLMKIALKNMKESTSYADCWTALGLVQGITAGELTSDDYVFRAFVGFATIGSVLASVIDANDDGNADADSMCTSGTSLEVGKIGVSLDDAISSLQAAGGSVADSVASAYDALCTGGFPCSVTDPTAYTANQIKALRSAIRAKEVGLNSCGDTINNCLCP